MNKHIKSCIARLANDLIVDLANNLIAAGVLTGLAIWFTAGFIYAFAHGFNAVESVLAALVISSLMGTSKGFAGGALAGCHITSRQFRADIHKHPFLCMLTMQIVGFLPYAAMLHIGGVTPGEGESAIVAAIGSILCAAIGARGHTADSRGWDVFWQGGGLAGLIVSKLDNAAFGPSPIDA